MKRLQKRYRYEKRYIPHCYCHEKNIAVAMLVENIITSELMLEDLMNYHDMSRDKDKKNKISAIIVNGKFVNLREFTVVS